MSKRQLFLRWFPLLVALIALLPACSDDEPPMHSEYDILGIWTDNDKHFVNLENTDDAYEYSLREINGEKFWEKQRLMYFFEPVSCLLMKEDTDYNVQVYQVISYNNSELVWCWVSSPEISMDGENKYEFLKIFFDDSYVVDPNLYETFHKISKADLEKALGDIPVLSYDD